MTLSPYARNARDIHAAVMRAIRVLAAYKNFDGTPTDLLQALEEFTTSRDPKDWPRSADALGRHVCRLVEPLRRLGVVVRYYRTPDSKRERRIAIGLQRCNGNFAAAQD